MANQFLTDDYEASEQTRTYMGEWHTHPESDPTPSGVDMQSIENNYLTATHSAPFLFMVIVGTESIYISVYNGDRFEEIEPVIV